MNDQMKVAIQRCLPQQLMTRFFGRLAFSEIRWLKNYFIHQFIKRVEINVEEAISANVDDYAHFNAFFTRRLKAGVRIWPKESGAIASPCDGALFDFGQIEQGTLIQAKQHQYSVQNLLGGDSGWARHFDRGQFATFYLSPKDYHRVHLPVDARLIAMAHIPGRLFSVNAATVEHVPGLYTMNTRVVTLWETDSGPMAMVFVGALNVGSVSTPWAGTVRSKGRTPTFWYYPNTDDAYVRFKRGDDCGFFHFGSTVVLLMSDTAKLSEQLCLGQPIKVGEPVGFVS